MKKMKYNLIDYKGKFDIVQDKGIEDDFDYVCGEISHEDVVAQAADRKSSAEYYGVPAYVGRDEELRKLFD